MHKLVGELSDAAAGVFGAVGDVPVYLSVDNLLYEVEWEVKHTAVGIAFVMKQGKRVAW